MTLITQPFFITHNTTILYHSRDTALSITHTTQPLCHFNTHIHVFLVESGVVENAVRVSDLLGHGLRLHSAVNTRQSSQQLPAQCSQHKTEQSTAACTVQSTQDRAVNSCLHSAVNTRQSSQQLIHSAVNTRQSSQQLPAQCSHHKTKQSTADAQCSQHTTEQSTAACTVQSTQDKAVNSCLRSAVNTRKAVNSCLSSAVNTRQSSQQLPGQCSQHKTEQSTAARTVQSTQDRAVNNYCTV